MIVFPASASVKFVKFDTGGELSRQLAPNTAAYSLRWPNQRAVTSSLDEQRSTSWLITPTDETFVAVVQRVK